MIPHSMSHRHSFHHHNFRRNNWKMVHCKILSDFDHNSAEEQMDDIQHLYFFEAQPEQVK
jgi:hypothetical protein